ncbi:MAG: hydrogenase maturation nickel metallochaperone HypA [Candidatus Promineifilaceae bacterium]
MVGFGENGEQATDSKQQATINMHELVVTENILEMALHHAQTAGGGRVTDLHIVLGELSSFVDDSIQFYWNFVSEGTAAAGARLHFRRVPAEMVCQDCQHRYSPREHLTCPICGSEYVRVAQGEEFYLEAIDVDTDADSTAGIEQGNG